MDKSFEAQYHLAEETNWWFVARRQAILSMMRDMPKDASVLDIGCAGGTLLSALREKGFKHLAGIDISAEAIARCRGKGFGNVFLQDAHDPQFPDESFDLIISSDSLEHLEHDIKALNEWKRILKKGGKAIIFVPAFKSLWSEHDVVNHHYRRYSRRELTGKLINAGFVIERIWYWNFLLFFPLFIYRKLQKLGRKNGRSRHDLPRPVQNWILTWWLGVENGLSKLIRFPVGVSLMAIVRKPE